MTKFLHQVKGNGDPKGKPRVYFTCHPDDFPLYFEKIKEDLFKAHDCALYYTEDLSTAIAQEDLDADLGQMNLFVVPVTFKLLTEPCRAMEQDLAYAKERHVKILPFMMESGIDFWYSRPEAFGELQYLCPFSTDLTEISYESKLKKYLDAVLVSDETANRIRRAFDAYIFLSYRKKDRREANRLMRMIHRTPGFRDIAIWYDEFLTPGESFSENIKKALENSRLFALLVTPNLLEEPNGKPNFVMGEEYPAAARAAMPVFPAEMVDTDRAALAEKFEGLPECVDARNDDAFRQRLLQTLTEIAVTSNDADPEHNFLIGLAYLEGIDVEVDSALGLSLVTEAAEAGLPEAMLRLYSMYSEGRGVAVNYQAACRWAEALYAYSLDRNGKAHRDTLIALQGLSTAHFALGNREKALELSEEVYRLSREILGEDHPTTLSALNNLFSCHSATGNRQRAIEIGEEAAKRCAATLGEEHPYTLSVLHNLAIALHAEKQIERAHELDERVYAVRLRILGETHPDTLRSLGRIVSDRIDVARATGDYSGAIDLAQRSCALRRRERGEKHPDTLSAMNELAAAHFAAKDLENALSVAEETYALRREVLGETHPDSMLSLSNLLTIYGAMKDYEKMAHLAEREYSLLCQTLGPTHKRTVRTLENRLTIARELMDWDQIVTVSVALYEARQATLGEKHPDTGRIRSMLASVCGSFSSLETVRSLRDAAEQTCYELYGKLGTAHADTRKAIDRLILLRGTDPATAPQAEMSLVELLEGTGPRLSPLQTETMQTVLAAKLGEADPVSIRYLGLAASAYAELDGYREKAVSLRRRQYELLLSSHEGAWDWEIDSSLFLLGAELLDEAPEEAARLFLSLRDRREATWGKDHPSYRDATESAAEAYEKAGIHSKEMELREEAYLLRLKADGIKRRSTRDALYDLANACRCAGENEKAAELYEQLYEKDCEFQGAEDDNTLAILSLLADAHGAADHRARSAELYGRLYQTRCKLLGEIHERTDAALSNLAYQLAAMEDHARAIESYGKLYSLRRELYGPEDKKTLLALSQLAFSHFSAGELAAAEELYEQLYRTRLALLGEEDRATQTALRNLKTVRERRASQS